jgi:DNA-directed RNA polymerase subunit RPC12/RpoP
VFAEFQALYPQTSLCAHRHGFEIDVLVPELGVAIEVDGYPWHLGREDADRRKSKTMNAAGYRFIRLRDVKLSSMDDPCVGFDAAINKTHVDALLEKAGASRDTIDSYVALSDYQNQAGFRKAGTVRRRPRQHRSLAFLAPEIARKWDYKENAPLLPTAFSAQSNLKAWFVCPTCNSSYNARIAHRTQAGSGCPYCSGRIVLHELSFAGLHPKALKDWNFEKNEIDPWTIAPGSNVRVHWKCSSCGHEYSTSPSKKVATFKYRGVYSGCLQCYRGRGSKNDRS